jgi:hypothetical protein
VAVPVFATGRDRKLVANWIDAWAVALADEGLPARLGAAGERGFDSIPIASVQRYAPAAFIGYRISHYPELTQRQRGWLSDSATTDTLAKRSTAWSIEHRQAQCWVGTAFGNVQATETDPGAFLAASARWSPNGKFATLGTPGKGFHSLAWGDFGICVAQSAFLQCTWQELVQIKVGQLLLAPELTDVAHIKTTGSAAFNFADITLCGAPETGVDPVDYQFNRHLWDEYVIDAAGISLLTSKHLAHARNLSEWTIEEVAADRYLVTARDLAPWYAGQAADHDTINRARHDFGDMVLTWDTIHANPGPWTSRRRPASTSP